MCCISYLIYVFALFSPICICVPVEERIVNGFDADISAIPYQLQLTSDKNLKCGASLISSRYGLTAAHCTIEPARYYIRAGSSIFGKGGFVTEVKVFNHPQFGNKGPTHDIAILALITPIKFTNLLRPIALINDNVKIPYGQMALASGWGKLGSNKPDSNQLQAVHIQVVKCRTMRQFPDLRIVCTGNGIGRQGTCQGDSGGALVINNKLVGISSFTERICASGPSSFTSVASYRSFIREITGI